jgi:hypothetical protein
MIERELAQLPVSSAALDRDGSLRRAKRRNHGRDGRVVELHAAELLDDGWLPCRVWPDQLLALWGARESLQQLRDTSDRLLTDERWPPFG